MFTVTRNAPDYIWDEIYNSVGNVERSVNEWLLTCKASNERNHPSLRQLLVDLRDSTDGLRIGDHTSIASIIILSLRTQEKVHDERVTIEVKHLCENLYALESYLKTHLS